MQITKRGSWRLLCETSTTNLFDKVQNNDFEIIDTLKDDYRSQVYRIRLSELDLVLKIPNEKNTRKWIRFLTWFRMGEAFKNVAGMNKLTQLGIDTIQPLIAAERRSFGMVVDSWLVYEYLDGNSCLNKEEHYPKVVEKLKAMHQKNILHGDAQIRNFMYANDTVYVIDSNPKSAGIFGFSKAYEFAYLRKSAPGIEAHFGNINESKMYRFAFSYDIYDRKLARWRKRVKKSIREFIGG